MVGGKRKSFSRSRPLLTPNMIKFGANRLHELDLIRAPKFPKKLTGVVTNAVFGCTSGPYE